MIMNFFFSSQLRYVLFLENDFKMDVDLLKDEIIVRIPFYAVKIKVIIEISVLPVTTWSIILCTLFVVAFMDICMLLME